MFNINLEKNHRAIFFGSWFLINILQATFTSLQEDEAYYWVYSRFLDWGYFDHPPMIALLVKAGTIFFPGEIGVRFFCVVLNTLTILLIEKLLSNKNSQLFYAICLSVAVLQIAGFWAVPDIPLIFFTALFFYVYKLFLDNRSWLNTIALAFVTAFLLYSKYHGVFIVFFTLIANLKILKEYKVYIAGLLAFVLFLPHMWWQYQHDWITFRFQLFEKNAEPYNIGITIKYIVGQLLVAGPIAGFILILSSFLYKTKTIFERVLKFNALGILLFFLINSFRGNIEANWTAPAIVPMIILTHNYLNEKVKWKNLLFKLLPVTLILVIIVRVVMIADILPVPAIKERFHSWNDWPKTLSAKTGGLPMVIPNSYQKASLYWFYTGDTTYALNSYYWRRNHFDYWPIEDSILGKPVYMMYNYDKPFTDSISTPLGVIGFARENSFTAFSKIQILTDSSSYHITEGEPVTVEIEAQIPPNYKEYLLQNPGVNPKIKIAFYSGIELVGEMESPITVRDLLKNPKQIVSFSPPALKDKLSFEFAIQAIDNFYTHNSYKKKLIRR